jgi:hypothetical protein
MLRLLRCRDHTVPAARRKGNVGERLPVQAGEPATTMEIMISGAPLPAGVRDHHVVDLFEVRCPNEAVRSIYMDLYHCPGGR